MQIFSSNPRRYIYKNNLYFGRYLLKLGFEINNSFVPSSKTRNNDSQRTETYKNIAAL
jgi:hypothetical protein